jgi:cytochrome c-type biogenesis protein CcmH/NrfG
MIMKKILFFLSALFLLVMTAPLATATERVNILEEQNIEQKIHELSEEWQRHFVDAVNHFLEKELTRLRKNKAEPKEGLTGQIEKYQDEIKQGSRDPETFIALARLYDRMQDGAGAIINARKAEKIFVDQKNVKGTAEARRSLRHYFEKYNYKPEDFELSQ